MKSYMLLGFLMTALSLSSCSGESKKTSDFYCATPAGIQHFTSPQAEVIRRPGVWFVMITDPGTGEELLIPFTSCVVVRHPQ